METIRGAEQLVAVFGYWPTFHDAEVLRVSLSRDNPAGDRSPTLELDIYAYDTDGTTTTDGYYRLTHQVVVTFRFEGIDALVLEDFNRQNVIGGLGVEPVVGAEGQSMLEVELSSIYGLGGTFRCRTAEIVGVRAWQQSASGTELRDA
jgi:hypothetical protein